MLHCCFLQFCAGFRFTAIPPHAIPSSKASRYLANTFVCRTSLLPGKWDGQYRGTPPSAFFCWAWRRTAVLPVHHFHVVHYQKIVKGYGYDGFHFPFRQNFLTRTSVIFTMIPPNVISLTRLFPGRRHILSGAKGRRTGALQWRPLQQGLPQPPDGSYRGFYAKA